MIVIHSKAVQYLFRINDTPFKRYMRKIDGLFLYNNHYWFDVVLLKRKFPFELIKKLKDYSISFSELAENKFPKQLSRERRLKLAMLMLTIEEASVLTRIPQDAFRKAIILGDIKTVVLGAYQYIPRSELERVLGIIINEGKLRDVVLSTLIKTNKNKVD